MWSVPRRNLHGIATISGTYIADFATRESELSFREYYGKCQQREAVENKAHLSQRLRLGRRGSG